MTAFFLVPVTLCVLISTNAHAATQTSSFDESCHIIYPGLLKKSEQQIRADVKQAVSCLRARDKDGQEALQKLQAHLVQKMAYHKDRINNTFDGDRLKRGAPLIAGVALLAGTAYVGHIRYAPLSAEYKRICDSLSAIGVSVSERSVTAHVTIEFGVPLNQSAVDKQFTQQSSEQLLAIYKKKNRVGHIESMVGSIGLFAVLMSYPDMYKGLFPQHKQRYEKLAFLHQALSEAIA